jgi:hypothetical protein
LTTVPVRKPNKQDFIRVHPDPDYRLGGGAMIEASGIVAQRPLAEVILFFRRHGGYWRV